MFGPTISHSSFHIDNHWFFPSSFYQKTMSGHVRNFTLFAQLNSL